MSKNDTKEDDSKMDDTRNPDVVNKYKIAGDIVNKSLEHVIAQCKTGATIVEICDSGDKYIAEECSKIFKAKKALKKGVAFPTCISVNNVVGHFSPLADDKRTLAKGDVAKIDLGVHIDGYIAVAAHTIVVGDNGESKEEVTGKVADAVNAAYTAAELAIRMVKPGQKNSALTDMFSKVASEFKCNVLAGVLSHEMNRFVIDGEKVIISKSDVDQKVEEFKFEPNQVFAIDVVMSTGEGKPKEIDERTTVYKRAVEEQYSLKLKASRAVLSEINDKFPTFPFSLRAMDDSKVLFGIKECANHELVHGYPVLYEKEGETIAHFKFTCLLLPTGTMKISGPKLDVSQFKSEHSLKDEELLQVLQTSVGKKKKKANKKKKKPAAEEK